MGSVATIIFGIGPAFVIESLACNVTNTDHDEALRALQEVAM
jgi:hypothetical protein